MDTSSWRLRVIMEPRGFIRVLEVIFAIVSFATTGGYSGETLYSIKCANFSSTSVPDQPIHVPIKYPFDMSAHEIEFKNCTGSSLKTRMEGDLSPTAHWFVFVGVTSFLYSLLAIIFYVVFEANFRQTKDTLATVGDFAITVIYAFLWLTAASSWAWGLGQVKSWADKDRFLKNLPLSNICDAASKCPNVHVADYSPLNASVAFAFLNFFLWSCNIWFLYKETPYYQQPGRQQGNNDSNAPLANSM